MNCPACGQELIVVEHNKIELDYCPMCRGLWFDSGELALLGEVLGSPVVISDFSHLSAIKTKEDIRRCPRCPKKMDKILLGGEQGIVIDRCPQGCGLWFDTGELGRVMSQFLKHGPQQNEKVIHFLGEVFSIST